MFVNEFHIFEIGIAIAFFQLKNRYPGGEMKIKYSKQKARIINLQEENHKEEESLITNRCDEDGKIIFLNENVTPNWLIAELNNRFRCDKNRGSKYRGLPA